MQIQLTITEAQLGERLDRILSRAVKDCSRKTAADSISGGQIVVNGRIRKPGYRVQLNDRVTGAVEIRPALTSPVPEKIELNIVYEDAHLIVINKAAGMVVHPAAGHSTGTLVNALIAHCPGIVHAGDDDSRSGIVHRLDKDTSGIMIAAKTDPALNFLQKEFKMRRVAKTYVALVTGAHLDHMGEIDLPIGRHPVKRKKMSVNRQTGKRAVTRWKVLQRLKDACMVEVFLMTGRTHQIRVHFYALGHPLINDPVYQYRKQRKQHKAGRQMLHAKRLSFRHPYSGRRVEFSADPPKDFVDMAAWLENNSTRG